MLNYQRLAAAGGLVPGPGGVPLGVYPEGMSAYLSGIAADQPPFYANPVSHPTPPSPYQKSYADPTVAACS